MIEFQGWPKTPRLFRDMTITEKIDGTNAAIIIEDMGQYINPYPQQTPSGALGVWTVDGREYAVAAQSRKRLLQLGDDNFGFALWVSTHAPVLVEQLGAGRHFGEWWGLGIQRGYGQNAKRFSLFNTHRYAGVDVRFFDGTILNTVPVLYQGPLSEGQIRGELDALEAAGSVAAKGFNKPEGVIVFHHASGHVYKSLLENDDTHKEALRG